MTWKRVVARIGSALLFGGGVLFLAWHIASLPDAAERRAIQLGQKGFGISTEGIYDHLFQIIGQRPPAFLPVRARYFSISGGPESWQTELEILRGCPHLHSVKGSVFQLRDEDCSAMRRCRELQAIEFSGAPDFHGTGLRFLPHNPKLKFINFEWSGFDDDGARELQRFPQIEELELHDTRITDKGLALIAEMPGLKFLMLSSPHLTNAGLSALARCRTLEGFDITPHDDAADPDAVNQDGIDRLKAAMPWCRL